MRLWRIASPKWALDKICEGARNYGGRWNPIGTPAFYAGSTPEIAALEKFVHLAGASPPPLQLVAVDVPDDESLVYQPSRASLPMGWADLPASAAAQAYGKAWIAANVQLVLLVPSAVVPESINAVINPLHPRYADVTLTVVRDFTFDARMLK